MRKILLIVLMAVSPAFVTEGWAEPTRDDVMAGAERCNGIAENRLWLDCFYGSAQPMRGLLGLPPAPASQVKLVPPAGAVPVRPVARAVAPPPEHSGGFFEALLGSTRPVVSNMPMAGYKFARDRTFTVTLQDGSVWQQTDSDSAFATWKKPPASYLVTINNSTGDSYALKVKSQPGVVYRVTKR
ncbi:MAG: hypothetical protein JWN16_959 [Alphaproteobacteria bacterium]|nr:hypothetical protein [Alphaproteobacteria bacterium]